MTSYKTCRTAVFAFGVSLALLACASHHYTASTVTAASDYATVIERAQKKHRYIIMQSGINLYTVTSVDMDKARQQMTVTLDKLDSTKFLNTAGLGSTGYNPAKGKTVALPQLHIHLSDSTSYTYDEPHTIPMVKVGRLEVVD